MTAMQPLLLFLLLVFVGCHRKSPGAVQGTLHVGTVPASEAGAAIGRAYCAFVRRCCPDFVRISPEVVLDGCEKREGLLRAVEPMDGPGRAVYDESRVRRCLARINGASCSPENDLVEMLQECYLPWNGTLSPGSSCRFNYDCRDGYCEREQDLDQHGICRASPREGESCKRADCVRGLTCLKKVCVRPRPLGAPCSRSEECASEWCRTTGNGRFCTNSHCGLYPFHYFVVTGKRAPGDDD